MKNILLFHYKSISYFFQYNFTLFLGRPFVIKAGMGEKNEKERKEEKEKEKERKEEREKEKENSNDKEEDYTGRGRGGRGRGRGSRGGGRGRGNRKLSTGTFCTYTVHLSLYYYIVFYFVLHKCTLTSYSLSHHINYSYMIAFIQILYSVFCILHFVFLPTDFAVYFFNTLLTL